MTSDDDPTAYAVDRSGTASHAQVLERLVDPMEHDTLRESIDAYGLEAVAQRFLATVVADGTVYGDAGAAEREADRLLDSASHASPRVHEVTVADLADLFTRLGLTDPPS